MRQPTKVRDIPLSLGRRQQPNALAERWKMAYKFGPKKGIWNKINEVFGEVIL